MVLATHPPLPVEEAEGLDKEEALRLQELRKGGRRRSHVDLPVTRLERGLTAIAFGLGLSHKLLLRAGAAHGTTQFSNTPAMMTVVLECHAPMCRFHFFLALPC